MHYFYIFFQQIYFKFHIFGKGVDLMLKCYAPILLFDSPHVNKGSKFFYFYCIISYNSIEDCENLRVYQIFNAADDFINANSQQKSCVEKKNKTNNVTSFIFYGIPG
jgi:hypothetical protein